MLHCLLVARLGLRFVLGLGFMVKITDRVTDRDRYMVRARVRDVREFVR